jgi:hypothetical protein
MGLPTRRSRSVRSPRPSSRGVRSHDRRAQKGTRSDTTNRAMTDIITHRLVGYDRASGRVAVEYDVPDRFLELAKRVAKVGADDPQAALCYRLDDLQAHDLAVAIGAKIDGDQSNFYLEGFAEIAPGPDGDRSPGVLADASRLLAEVRTLRGQQAQREWEGINDAFLRIRRGWKEIKWRQIESEGEDAPRHNLIRLLRLQDSEVKFYSPFLCDLLDPFGTHGQRTLFLRSFLFLVSDQARRDNIAWNYQWREGDRDPAEWSILGEREKIDISIRNRKQRILVYIENKIRAGFQDRQLCRYRERLERRKQDYDHRLLVLLTPRDHGPVPEACEAHVHLTYEDDISPWIGTILRERLPITLRGNLLQYQQSISLLAGDPPMANRELIELIAASGNLPCAWDIVEAIDQVEQLLRARFWDSVHKNLVQDLTNLQLTADWSVQISEEIRENPKSVGGVYISANEAPALQLGVFQEGQKIYYGLRFSSLQQPPLPAEVRSLWAVLPAEWKKEHEGLWLAWYDSGYGIWRREEFLLHVAEDALGVSQPMTERVIRILRDCSQEVIAANSALAHGARP